MSLPGFRSQLIINVNILNALYIKDEQANAIQRSHLPWIYADRIL